MLNTPEQSKQFRSPEEEIESLKKRIEELKTASPEGNKEAVIEAVKEHAKKALKETLHKEYKYVPNTEELEKHNASIFDLPAEEHDRQIIELLNLAREKGIINAVNLISKTGNAHLLDDFERALARKISKNDN